MLYFAYGSNMSLARLKARTPSITRVNIATLAGHQLKFHKLSHDGSGKCDIMESDGLEHQVIGVLYELSEPEKPLLDGYEGLGNGYEEKQVSVQTPDQKTHQAITYYATHIEADLKPYDWYLAHVLQGAIENQLPKDYVNRIKAISCIDDPDSERSKKERAIYHSHSHSNTQEQI